MPLLLLPGQLLLAWGTTAGGSHKGKAEHALGLKGRWVCRAERSLVVSKRRMEVMSTFEVLERLLPAQGVHSSNSSSNSSRVVRGARRSWLSEHCLSSCLQHMIRRAGGTRNLKQQGAR
eukprot:110897-Pelagomonas_calceolata.AAC.2